MQGPERRNRHPLSRTNEGDDLRAPFGHQVDFAVPH